MVNHLYVSSSVRHVEDPVLHGAIRKVDWDSKTIVAAVDRVFPWQFCLRNENPRGGVRGWKGLLLVGDEVVVANNDSLIFYTKDLQRVNKVLTHPSLGSIHGLSITDGKLKVASTLNDMYATIDKDFKFEFFPVLEDEVVLEAVAPWLSFIGRSPSKYNSQKDYREKWYEDTIHLNYIRSTKTGAVVALFNSCNMLIQLEPTIEVLWAPDIKGWKAQLPPDKTPHLYCPHDLIELDDGGFLISSSGEQAIYKFVPASKELIRLWDLSEKDCYGWLRGLDLVGDSLFVGTGVGKVFEISLSSREIVSEMQVFEDWEGHPHAVFSVVHEHGFHTD